MVAVLGVLAFVHIAGRTCGYLSPVRVLAIENENAPVFVIIGVKVDGSPGSLMLKTNPAGKHARNDDWLAHHDTSLNSSSLAVATDTVSVDFSSPASLSGSGAGLGRDMARIFGGVS